MINFKKYGKRCLSLFLAASMILMPAVQIFAEEETAAATTDSTQTAEEEQGDTASELLCDRTGFKQCGELATGTGNLCGLCNRYGYEQWGSFI